MYMYLYLLNDQWFIPAKKEVDCVIKENRSVRLVGNNTKIFFINICSHKLSIKNLKDYDKSRERY